MSDLRLVIFDVDGTLVDSQAEIVAAMTTAFTSEDLVVPDRGRILSIVGLSLDVAVARLCPDLAIGQQGRVVQAYKDSYMALRGADGKGEQSPLYPGARDVLDHLAGQDNTLLAIATGKSRRGLDKILEKHGLQNLFHSEQVADDHPSKPNPSMILTALNDTGTYASAAVMIGDTTFDMDMGRAAGVRTIGVSWGYHDAVTLRPDLLIDSFSDLIPAIDQLTGPKT
ncbi:MULTISPECIES: HAD-IA family hydrolase [unclassified Yoonia]|uniref:HAD-IA family hydrolase n=1 Tax=unclassified Yoonia TaxID=2629118 RepID=UPI002AFEACBB|nr:MULTISPECIES: HAD-IA family hydrolase [unclassified Yoonia]